MDVNSILGNKLLVGLGAAIVGFALVLFAPKPINTAGLVVFILGLGVTALGVYEQVTGKNISQAVEIPA